MSDRYAVVGNPIEHSKSPLIHAAFARQTRQDIEYGKVLAPLDGFAAEIEHLRTENYKGCNVTVPFKQEAWRLVGKNLSIRAQAAQAVNTLSFAKDSIYGDNTDGIGIVRDITVNLGVHLQGKRILLMGAGGAARGVLLPLLLEQPESLTVVNRTVDKAIDLAHRSVAELTGFDKQPCELRGCDYENLTGLHFDIVINATASSLNNDLPPLPSGVFAAGALAYDMMYGRETPFMKFAREQGATIVADGLGMLVEQAAEAFFIWRGIRPQTAPVIAQLRG